MRPACDDWKYERESRDSSSIIRGRRCRRPWPRRPLAAAPAAPPLALVGSAFEKVGRRPALSTSPLSTSSSLSSLSPLPATAPVCIDAMARAPRAEARRPWRAFGGLDPVRILSSVAGAFEASIHFGAAPPPPLCAVVPASAGGECDCVLTTALSSLAAGATEAAFDAVDVCCCCGASAGLGISACGSAWPKSAKVVHTGPVLPPRSSSPCHATSCPTKTCNSRTPADAEVAIRVWA
mmetsp:Transcript_13362/g.43999  ORF Transcript_13362/g.43999 Transcript_13362/m.43999 type:complete len:237 (-) Transcript_13362:829-1539(-)